jgi:hypothetical protein
MSVMAREWACKVCWIAEVEFERSKFQTRAFWLEVLTIQYDRWANGDHCTSAGGHCCWWAKCLGGEYGESKSMICSPSALYDVSYFRAMHTIEYTKYERPREFNRPWERGDRKQKEKKGRVNSRREHHITSARRYRSRTNRFIHPDLHISIKGRALKGIADLVVTSTPTIHC